MAGPRDHPKVVKIAGNTVGAVTDAVTNGGGGEVGSVLDDLKGNFDPGLTPPGGGGGGSGLPGRVLKVHSLQCHENEDWGSDEAILGIFVDNLPAAMPVGGTKEMGEGDTWILDGVVPFLDHVRVELHEEDWPDGNDHLGTVNIDTRPVRGATAKFTQDDADYTLSYDVLEPKELAADELAKLKSFLGV
jgi:hypothetical protein